ncbi:MAG: DEAD/DEAH box helicase [Solobacterium sp.]|nr:DEAD/DEAH box helicase [Solobacterium sp.]
MDISKPLIDELKKSIESAFVDRKIESQLSFQPRLLFNDAKEGQKVLPHIEKELSSCEEFFISVAFIQNSGIEPLMQVFRELEARGVKGKILTTDYLHFSDPVALRRLNALSNIEIRMYMSEDANEGFHTKGYIFKEKGLYKIIIGSSNLTQSALTKNKEWNSKFVSTANGEYVDTLLNEFETLWDSKYTKKYSDFIEGYTVEYLLYRKVRQKEREIREQSINSSYEIYHIEPNSMQQTFLDRLKQLVDQGEKRALLISATGTGKTYASAFAIRDMKPKKVLFLVHREQIAKKSMESYRKIFGDAVSYGLLSGTSKDRDSSFLFATRDTMAKDETLLNFEPEEFDVICVDEVHRAGARTYQKIMNYFQPKFWLGMTATPERTDGFDIYKLFDHNIACEIRLQQAMEDDLLCPFHYFGITDLMIDGEEINDESGLKNFRRLVSTERVNHLINNINYYGFSGNRVKGLIFVSRKEEGKELSKLFNERGYHTAFLSGEDSQEDRLEMIDRLVDDNYPNRLDYIFSVDIFNEGIDIPELNQIVMLRPTQSPIIFVQQLGRGLRKADDKEFVVILDFIGNYTNNYMIPIALSGDRSYNKDNMRRYVTDGARIIPGSSTVHFDEISRKRIYQSIDQAKTNDSQILKDAYKQLKYKIGRVPKLSDFDRYESIDALKFISKYGSYYYFLKNVMKEEDYPYSLSESEQKIIQYISTKFMSGKKGQELFLLHTLLTNNNTPVLYDEIVDDMGLQRSPTIRKKERQCLINGLNLDYLTFQDKKKYAGCELVKTIGNHIILSDKFEKMLQNPVFYNITKETIEFGLNRFLDRYLVYYKETNLCLYQKYTYEEVFRALNWEADQNKLNIGGYKYDEPTKTLPVFINYDKADDAIPYQDRFISESDLIALSKHPRKIDSPDVDHIYKRTENDKENKIYLFVRKNKDDGESSKEFYFLGEMYSIGVPQPVTVKDNPAFEIHYRLDKPVRDDIYDYIISGEEIYENN